MLVREAYAVCVGFYQVRTKGEWLKPKGAPNGWKSRVDFELIQRVNPRAGDPKTELVRNAELEIRGEMQRDALMSKAKAEWSSRAVDVINS